MVEIRSDALDKMCEDFEQMKFKAAPWWPTVEEIKIYIEPHFETKYKFAIWITETADQPQNEAEQASKKYLLNLIYTKLKITD